MLGSPHQFGAVDEGAVPSGHAAGFFFQNPAAVFFAAEGEAQGGEGKIGVKVDHAEGLL